MESRDLSSADTRTTSLSTSAAGAPDRSLKALARWIEQHLKLKVNRNKSGTGWPWDSQFLGFCITEEREVSIAPKSIDRYKTKVREAKPDQQRTGAAISVGA